MSNPLIDSLARAVQAAPEDVPLRLHLAEQLLHDGRGPEAVTHCAIALQHSPEDRDARALMARALAPSPTAQAPLDPAVEPTAERPQPPTGSQGPLSPQAPAPGPLPAQSAASQPAPAPAPASDTPATAPTPDCTNRPEPPQGKQKRGNPAEPSTSGAQVYQLRSSSTESPKADPEDWEVEPPKVKMDDVGGLADVKNRIEAAFLAPMRNPELRRLYGKSLRGGLLLYGPPGVGKTFIARAVAGEMGAGFINVTITDILDPLLGNSEANLHAIFQQARHNAPCVVFLDEIDAIGIKRSLLRFTGIRGTVNQLLQELDGIGSDNEGVYVMAATNTPWDIDPALRRPGRLDRTVLVLPPDAPARNAILRTHLKDRPTAGLDLDYLARVTDGLTGADLAHLCDTAVEKALLDSVHTGEPRSIQMPDLLAALQEVHPSTGPWFDIARNVVEFADRSGEYAELRAWMKARKLL